MSTGINPNNHRLSRNFCLPHRNPQRVTGTAMSFGIKSINCDQESDAASCLENDSSAGLPDLNLDLAISVPPSSPSNNVKEEQRLVNEPQMSGDIEFGSSPPSTLPLFR